MGGSALYEEAMATRRRVWRALVGFAFQRLYNEFAWTYDAISHLVSKGEWKRWQRAALSYLQGTKVLEIGFGTGRLLSEMVARGYECYGADPSPFMVTIAAKKLQQRGVEVPLCRARAQALPFGEEAFDSLLLTFPASFILDPRAQREIARVLAPEGHLVIVNGGRLLERDPWSRFLNWALDITSGDGSPVQLLERLKPTGLAMRGEERVNRKSKVRVIVGEKRRGPWISMKR